MELVIVQCTDLSHAAKHVQDSPLVKVVKVVIQLLRVVRVIKQWLQLVPLVQVVMWYLSVK